MGSARSVNWGEEVAMSMTAGTARSVTRGRGCSWVSNRDGGWLSLKKLRTECAPLSALALCFSRLKYSGGCSAPCSAESDTLSPWSCGGMWRGKKREKSLLEDCTAASLRQVPIQMFSLLKDILPKAISFRLFPSYFSPKVATFALVLKS